MNIICSSVEDDCYPIVWSRLRKGLDCCEYPLSPYLYEVPNFPHPALGIAGDGANPVLYASAYSTPYSMTISYPPMTLLVVERWGG